MIKSSKEKKQSSDYIPINLILISCSVTDEKMEKPKMEVVNVVFFVFFLEFSRTQVSPLFPVSYLLMALWEVLLRTSCSYNLQCQGSRL